MPDEMNDDSCPTCEDPSNPYIGRHCIDCGRDTRIPVAPVKKVPMPDDVKPDDPSDSAETLRIMADLERYADMHAPTLSDSADVMDEARHRLAVLQQACNAYPALRAELAEAKMLLHTVYDLLAESKTPDAWCYSARRDAYIEKARAFLARKESDAKL